MRLRNKNGQNLIKLIKLERYNISLASISSLYNRNLDLDLKLKWQVFRRFFNIYDLISLFLDIKNEL